MWAAVVVLLVVGGGCNLLPMGNAGRTSRLSTSPTASVTGKMIMEGGPLGHDGPRPMRGKVSFLLGATTVKTVRVGDNGKFATALPPGTYRVRGCTPDIQLVSASGAKTDACNTVRAVARAGRRTRVNLVSFVP